MTRTQLRVLSTLLARHAADLPDEALQDAGQQDAVRLLAWSTSAAALAAAALSETDPEQAGRYRAQVRATLAEAHALAWYPHG
ncbi:hypothetical protein [Streptacidiphilus monticola]|jgi:hypothetical protein|uniref:Aminoglycoside phosphotransferase n=1 Tax=Streptacidiphilus monticola TaxID=2161674 RepID=A0ABW1FVF1_9ACTN